MIKVFKSRIFLISFAVVMAVVLVFGTSLPATAKDTDAPPSPSVIANS